MFRNPFWKDFRFGLQAFLGFNWPSEATWKASVIKYANEERSESNDYPPFPLNFLDPGLQWEGSGRESLTRQATPQRGVAGCSASFKQELKP